MSITWDELAQVTNQWAEEDGEWCGAPMPVDSYELVIAPTYRFQGLNGMKFNEDHPIDKLAEAYASHHIVNSWWCPSRGGWVMVIRNPNGKSYSVVDREYAKKSAKTAGDVLGSIEVALVQDWKAELVAMGKLKSLIAPHLFGVYVLHGVFLETSKRSGVTYVFRKNRPTIALRPDRDGNMRVLCSLCLHGIGYYAGSFHGCMVPTDDVISHLIMMRAKEEFFWRKANQHPAYCWQSGL